MRENRWRPKWLINTITFTQGIHTNCRDIYINVHGLSLSILCFEVGYSESLPFLRKDMHRLLLRYKRYIASCFGLLLAWLPWHKISHCQSRLSLSYKTITINAEHLTWGLHAGPASLRPSIWSMFIWMSKMSLRSLTSYGGRFLRYTFFSFFFVS